MTSCGYSSRKADVVLGQKALPADQQRVFIPVVDNRTTRPGLEGVVTNALRERLSSVPGVLIVDSAEDANFLLLGTLSSYGRKFGVSSVTGNPTTASQGGLASNQSTAAEIRIEMGLHVKLVEKSEDLRKIVWTRSFSQGATFETSRRFSEKEGSTSAAQINDSRESIQVGLLAKGLARLVLDQVVQGF